VALGKRVRGLAVGRIQDEDDILRQEEERTMTPNEEWGLVEKAAIVTGGGAAGDGIGNGRAAAILLARAGCNAVAASYDVTDSKQCAAMVEDAVSRWGRLDCLDNNVGIGSKGTVVEETEENWARVMHVNVDTMFLACKHAIPAMIRTAGGGSIVNVSSISALRPRGLTAYSVSKGAVIALTMAMAVDHGPQGIRVNCVAPGPVYTPMVYTRGMTEQARDTRRQASVLKREGTGWDVGGAVRFLLSDQSRYITGHTLVVDGGATLVGPSRESQ